MSHACRATPPPALQVSLAAKPAGLKAKAPAARAPVARAVSCSAQKEDGNVVTAVAATALALTLSFGAVDAAYADVAGLTPCSESKAFAKRKKNEVRGAKQWVQAETALAACLGACVAAET